jgi:hypothetical protein
MGSIVKKGDTYYLYYTGSDRPRSDNGPANRSIGVATSTDGVNFTKYSGNPVVTHQPSSGHPNQEEEGAQEPMVALDSNGDFLMYWGALKAVSSSGVDVQVRVSYSTDGFHFTDKGSVTGWGSENWPVGVLNASGGTSSKSGNWHVWVTNHGNYVDLYMGSTPYSLSRVGNVLDCCNKVQHAWPVHHMNGKVSVVEVSGSGWLGSDQLKVRETTINALDRYSSTIMTFGIPYGQNPCIFADKAKGLWRLYWTDYSTNERTILMKTAPLDGATTNEKLPFNFSVPDKQRIGIKLFDTTGKLVSIMTDMSMPQAYHQIPWYSNNLCSGIYVARIAAGSRLFTKKIVILK